MSTEVIKSERPVMPEAVHEKGRDVHVRRYVVYGHTDKKLYATEDHQTVITDAEDVFEAAMYGTLTVYDGTNYLAVVKFTEEEFTTYDGTAYTVATEASADI